jgi:hypothetical protein
MFGVQGGCLFSRDFFHTWDEDSGFRTVVVRDCEYGVVPLRYWEFSYEVYMATVSKGVASGFAPDGA